MELYKRLYRYIKPYTFRFIQAGICMAAVAGLTTLTIWIVRSVIDDVLIVKDMNKLFLVTVSFPLIFLLKGFFAYIQNYLMNFIGYSIIRDIRIQLYEHLHELSMEFFHKNPTGQLMSRITNDTSYLRTTLTQVPVQVIRDGLTVLFLTGTIFYLNWRFALITAILMPIAAVPISILGKKLRKTGRTIQNQMGDLFSYLQEGIAGNLIVKLFCREQNEIERFGRENERNYSLSMRWVRADVLGAPIMEFLGSFAAVFLLWYGGKDVIAGRWTTGSFLAFLGASISCYKPVKDFTSVNSLIQQGSACAERIFELLDQRPSVMEKKDAQELSPFKSEIHYKNISFSYDTGKQILHGVDLKIKAGEIVAFVGPSGSGKTTFTNLLPRLFDPEEGALLVDGTDIRNVSMRSLRKQIGIVTQETFLFNETIGYNIAYGKVDEKGNAAEASKEEIIEAAKVANAHEFISNLPNGYETVIGERGVRLSGGQKQRLSIARAVIKNPPILILDEATSSLDTESERLVQEALERLMANRTVLVIAHRLSTVKKSDRIIVIADGRIAEEGDHETLLSNSGAYKKLYEMQIH